MTDNRTEALAVVSDVEAVPPGREVPEILACAQIRATLAVADEIRALGVAVAEAATLIARSSR